MELEATPPLTATEDAALRHALALARAPVDRVPTGASAWRQAAAREAVDGEAVEWEPPARARYALSPRSTRGATRA